MSQIHQFLGDDHRACDAAWAEVERAAADGDVAATHARFTSFAAAMERHFTFEEERLFPALDAATGMGGMGPIAVMRHEHAQMRRLLATIAVAARAGDTAAVIDQGDTLLMLIGQHNAKEEHIVYPMSDAHLAGQWAAMRAAWPAIASASAA